MCLSILSLHRGPNFLIAHITMLLVNAQIPRIVNSQPSPIALIVGVATIAPTHEKMLRIKLLTATPVDDFRGMNSVSIVVAIAKMIIDPMP
jgi:hypothetical protein